MGDLLSPLLPITKAKGVEDRPRTPPSQEVQPSPYSKGGPVINFVGAQCKMQMQNTVFKREEVPLRVLRHKAFAFLPRTYSVIYLLFNADWNQEKTKSVNH